MRVVSSADRLHPDGIAGQPDRSQLTETENESSRFSRYEMASAPGIHRQLE